MRDRHHQAPRRGRDALLAGACALALGAASAGSASAQPASTTQAKATDATDVGEIVVTARKRNERLRDVPVSASVVDASAIADRGGLQGVRDLVTTVPSVALGDTSTPLTSEISIRGSGTSRGTSADSGVGLYRDGAYIGGGAQGGRTFSRFDLFDASQIEVLRGNQGALYGRDAVGGAINILTARPQMNSSGYASVQGGTKDYVEYQAVVNQALSDHFAVRLSADVMKQPKGFYCAPAIDYCVDSQSEDGYRAQARYENDRLDANLMLEHSKNKYPGLNLQLWVQPAANFPQGVFLEDMFIRHHNFRDNDTDQVNDAEFSFNYRFDFATLTSVTLWRDRKDSQQFDQDLDDPTLLSEILAAGLLAKGAAIPDINTSQQNHGETKSFNQELYLAGKVGERWNWLLGGEYVGLSDGDVITTARTPTKANPSVGAQRPSSQRLQSWAAYGSLEYDVTDALSVTTELRYTDDKKSFSGSSQDLTSGVISSVVNASTSPSNTAWDVTAAYKFGPEWMVYAKAGTAFRAGGFNSNLGTPLQPVPIPAAYGNENATSYEIGAKGNPISAIYLTAAIYRTEVDNLIIQTDNGCKATNPACPQIATVFATNGGQAWVEGAELEATAHAGLLGGDLTATLGGSWQKGKITSGQFAGDMPPQLPKYLASGDVNYTHDIFGLQGFANVVYSARWGGVQEIAQTPELHDYQLFNGRAGVRTGPWEFAAYMNNIGDYLYLQFDATSARRWSQPRTYGLQAIYRW